MNRDVLIMRDSAELSKPKHRVYVTGPHFGSKDIFSSTKELDAADVYDRAFAEELISQHWRGLNPELVPYVALNKEAAK